MSHFSSATRLTVQPPLTELRTTFRNAGDWLMRVPELSALFYEQRGSLADSFAFLSQLEGAEDRLFPGYSKFESSLDGRVMTERKSLRGALERQKMRTLEQLVRDGRARFAEAVSATHLSDPNQRMSVDVEAALLDADHLAAVKLALKTKRLPLVEEDRVMRANETLPLHERYSSGLSEIPLAEYYAPYESQCGFSRETLRIVEFLLANRRLFKVRSAAGLSDTAQVAEIASLCQNEHLLRSLFVFTCADRAEWESERSEPTRWFNTRELYAKTMQHFRPSADPSRALTAAGFSPEQLQILRDFGGDFFGGVYRQYANRFGEHLVRLFEEPDSTNAKASILRDGTATIVGVAARDYRGLAAVISGALWHCKVDLRQAHLFSAMNYGLALDFFHVALAEKPLPADVAPAIEEAIRRQLFISDADEAALPRLAGETSLHEWRPGQYCLRFETSQAVSGLIYALTYKVFRHLHGNIFGLSAHAARGKWFVSVYHSLPPDLSLVQARSITMQHF